MLYIYLHVNMIISFFIESPKMSLMKVIKKPMDNWNGFDCIFYVSTTAAVI